MVEDMTGKQLTLNKVIEKKQKDHIVLVDIWASWCAPCVKLMPFVEKLRAKDFKDNLTVISISIDKDKNDWKKAANKYLKVNKNNYLLIGEKSRNVLLDVLQSSAIPSVVTN